MGKDYYILNNGRLKRKENTFYFWDSATEANKPLPVEQIDSLHIFGEVDLNTKFINYASKYGVILNFYNYYGYYTGSFYPRKKNISGFLTVKQSQHYIEKEKRLYLAKCFVASAKFHIKRNLRNYKSVPDEVFTNLDKEIIDKAKEIDELMGIEGRIRNIYYKSYGLFLKDGFHMRGREKRPPNDPINALISFGNSLMYTTVLGQIYRTQLDPAISYLHEPSTRRFSLSLDLAEIFKPLIVDSVIFSLINNRIIKIEDFSIKDGICMLNDSGRRKVIAEYENKLSTTIKHRKLNRKVSYRGFIRLECYKIIKYLIGDELYKPLKAWW
ncbi:type I-B CRISPR-associated endonuclease Cas1b [Herbivorax sp. ANBcel31]|uniref:type I-B CRISPR-associated endonuclease Cas1b n=1 Tax=Herbivorax sp. ANBcel31 TaxID=3069754 RepID=UPI0027B2827E|nr:type I-B CRISPR-associated endonuclease Cas1b [Herbivorax sp. ANBcel31]MDQ2086775.1 type I-B CRISPR-associated endonuclease Cas1b [Herbivorax sp. ANBcel31]